MGRGTARRGGPLHQRPSVYLAYAVEDAVEVDRLYQRLVRGGCAPWMDRRQLLPGDDWQEKLRRAISEADFFLACFSTRSIRKRGWFQAELRYALEYMKQVPLGQCYFLPARLDDVDLPVAIQAGIQYVDLFPNREVGIRRVLKTIREQMAARATPRFGGQRVRYTSPG